MPHSVLGSRVKKKLLSVVSPTTTPGKVAWLTSPSPAISSPHGVVATSDDCWASLTGMAYTRYVGEGVMACRRAVGRRVHNNNRHLTSMEWARQGFSYPLVHDQLGRLPFNTGIVVSGADL